MARLGRRSRPGARLSGYSVLSRLAPIPLLTRSPGRKRRPSRISPSGSWRSMPRQSARRAPRQSTAACLIGSSCRRPASNRGAKTLHLPPPARSVLAELPRLDGNPHVIVGHKTGAAMVNLEKPWRAIRATAGLDDVRLHDLRHAFASVAASSGMGLPIIGKILGHTQAQTTNRYAHLASDPVKAAAAAVAGKIAAALNRGTTDTATVPTVLPMRSGT